MFEDPDVLSTRDLLERAASCRAIANRSDAQLLECAQIYADRYHPSCCPVRPARRPGDGRERAVVLGGDGCPEIAEFAVAEFAVVIGVSPGVGRDLIADALALRDRFPLTWARIQAGEATPWKARQIVRACTKLDHAAAGYVDRRVAAIIDTISPYRLDKIADAAKKYADSRRAADDAAAAADERGVYVGRGDQHGNKTIYIKAPAAAVNRHDTAIADIAEALKTLGDTRPLQHRRAEAVGILPDPRFTQELLAQAAQTPTHPAPTDPAQADPAPTDPDPADPAQADPAPTDPDPADPAPSDPAPSDPAPAGRAPTVPAPTGPAQAGPAQARPAPAGSAAVGAVLGGPVCGPGFEGGSTSASGTADLLEQWEQWEQWEPPHDAWLEAAGPEDRDPVSDPFDGRTAGPDPRRAPAGGAPMTPAAQQALRARLAQIKQDAHTNPSRPTRANNPDKGQLRPGKTEVVVHLTDHTLATHTGVLRAEGIGPLFATQLAELVGHGPYIVKPVIDLNDAVSVNAYEIPTRIRERVKLIHPVELFPYGTRETTNTIDLDHIEPYDPLGPTGQTSTTNLAPLGRFGHRVKTHARGWTVHRIDHKTLEWTTPHGFSFHVDPTGTHRVPRAEVPRKGPDFGSEMAG
ncbi:DUF222 domain-containing protein [Kribbella sp. NPDC059898]|uniref:DUF222 domain-containing protein n=1 Tax=Kribbella sp. NPDC059898 TaxID=3346995 RepID=UPI00364DE630